MKFYLTLSLYLITTTIVFADDLATNKKSRINQNDQATTLTNQAEITKKALEDMLIQAEKSYGKHAEELLPILEKLVLITQKNSPKESKFYNIRRTKIYLRHNSSEFITQFKDINLPTTKHSKDTIKRVNKFFKRDFKLYESAHWSIIYHPNQEKRVIRKIVPHMEKTYDSALSFLISFGFRNKPLKKKMTAIYFQSREDYINYFSKFTPHDKLIKQSLGVYVQQLNTLGFFDHGEGKKKVSPRTVSHESAHQIMFNAGLQLNPRNQPRWLFEGLASTFEPLDRKREFGPHTNNYSPKRMQQIIRLQTENAVPTLTDLVSSSYKAEYNKKNSSSVYAMGSMLVNFLYQHYPDEFKEYLKILAKSKPTRGGLDRKRMFSHAFGDPDVLQPAFEVFVIKSLSEFKELRNQAKKKALNSL